MGKDWETYFWLGLVLFGYIFILILTWGTMSFYIMVTTLLIGMIFFVYIFLREKKAWKNRVRQIMDDSED